ncbi:DUF6777 domain-containing protein [Streptomyces sp. NRRL S-350]|uniref:DUF6777 domain-containing protein n=1 Tax=Streptomyces sp. NRRL S-350 TaxID=1463902 RepID=UPI000691AC06|nr:DUF6777 domain-containing protein [Streptomyces sp. NRRL S-350]
MAGGRPRRPWWRSGKGLALAAGTVAVAVVATVLIVNNQGGHNEAVPAANEVALQAPADPGPDPFTPSVETQGVSAPAPVSSPAQPGGAASHPGGATPKSSSAAALHSVQGSSAGLYAGTMGKSSCDTERLIGMVSTGDTGRAWASAAGVAQADVPAYLRSLTPAYLRTDTRVTNHNYKSGAVVEYQAALQSGTAVLVDAQGVPRVRCSCGNPLKPPVLVSNAKYTGKAWAGFQPSTLVVVVPAPQPVAEIVLVDFRTGGWFSRLTGRIEIVDKHVEPPKGPLAPGIPPPGTWTPTTPSGTASAPTSGSTSATTSGATTSGSTTSGSTTSGSTTSSGGPSPSSGTPSGSTASTGTSAASTGASTSGQPPSSAATSSGPTTGTTTSAGKPTATSTSAGPATPPSPTATCATTAPSTLPPCPTTGSATPS